MKSTIPALRRLDYANGYLALGLLNEAAEELAAIDGPTRRSPAFVETSVALQLATGQWARAAGNAKWLTERRPDDVQGWISWAFATRRSASIADAETILLEAEKRFGPVCAIIQYNLACYRCQLGDLAGARLRLDLAFHEDPEWKRAARGDPDLAPLWPELAEEGQP